MSDVDEHDRSARHVQLSELGEAAQERLARARVLIVGIGGLGAPAALYLAAAGVGHLVLVDHDEVDDTNLQRQVIYSTADVGRSKVISAAARLRALNPSVEVTTVSTSFGPSSRPLVADADVVIDGTDNFAARYLVNDICVLERTPNVFGSVAQFDGQVSVFAAPGGPCYRCLHPEPPPDGLIPSCGDAGILGVLPGVVGMLQATEAIKLVCGIGRPLIGRLLLYDAWGMRAREIGLPRDPDCPVCGDAPTIRDAVAYATTCESGAMPGEVSVSELRVWRREGRPHVLVDVRDPSEHRVRAIEGSVLIPLLVLQERIAELPRDCPIVTHCQMGGRSSRAAEMLRARGFDARSLTGGIREWLRADASRAE